MVLTLSLKAEKLQASRVKRQVALTTILSIVSNELSMLALNRKQVKSVTKQANRIRSLDFTETRLPAFFDIEDTVFGRYQHFNIMTIFALATSNVILF